MSLTVRAVGASVLVEDLGRTGWAHLGVPRSGALDGPAAGLANRLVGNTGDAACLEVLLGGLAVSTDGGAWVAVTGAVCEVRLDDRPQAFGAAVWCPAGSVLALGTPREGLRSYLAVSGGIAVEPVLGSRSTDTLAGVGPPPVSVGDVIQVGVAVGPPAALDTPRPPTAGPLRLLPGPRAGQIAGDVLALLVATSYAVSPDSDRIGLRLDGAPLPLAGEIGDGGELPSEGMVLGAVQVPPNGRPVVFLADHPTTGGYPVVAVVEEEDLWQCAQLRPGETVRFTHAAPGRATG
ncbi:MAG: hypothetical protein QOH37_3160 [Nocardioidaceae bacterium]|nr:hypothetical protein [Nocardioidaceae bacterium]